MTKYMIIVAVFLIAAWYDRPSVIDVGLIWPSESSGSVFKVRGE